MFLSLFFALCRSLAFIQEGFPSDSYGKNPPAIQGTWVQSLGRKDSLEKGMVTHFNILAWKIPWTEEPGRLQPLVLHSQTQMK